MRLTNFVRLLAFCVFFVLASAAPCALFQAFPDLAKTIARIELADLPTPIAHMPTLGAHVGHAALYLKHDGLTGPVRDGARCFGGNKVRKLEFLLADARARGCCRVITVGAAGSNHALATTVYARQLGFDVDLVLTKQFKTPHVQRNLLLDIYYGAAVHRHEDGPVAQTVECVRAACCKRDGREPYVIPVGGSTPLGALGYVSAAFELKHQIDAGQMPAPDRIYVALGSAGTAAGLIVGLRAAGLSTRVVGVSVQANLTIGQKLLNLVRETNAFINALDKQFPLFEWSERDFIVDVDCFAGGYGLPGPDGMQAAKLVHQTEAIDLEQTYTAKAFVAFMRDAALYRDKTLLFWHTFSAGLFEKEASTIDGASDERLSAFAHFFAPPPVLRTAVS